MSNIINIREVDAQRDQDAFDFLETFGWKNGRFDIHSSTSDVVHPLGRRDVTAMILHHALCAVTFIGSRGHKVIVRQEIYCNHSAEQIAHAFHEKVVAMAESAIFYVERIAEQYDPQKKYFMATGRLNSVHTKEVVTQDSYHKATFKCFAMCECVSMSHMMNEAANQKICVSPRLKRVPKRHQRQQMLPGLQVRNQLALI